MTQQIIVFTVIAAALFFFIDGSVRYDFVAFFGLLVLVITGVISPENAFLGFSHPAVITVASVLVISSALIKTGVVDHLVVLLNKGPKDVSIKIMGLMVVTALLSGFMNNVGALALIMPIAIRVAKDSKMSPSQFLMPVSFASLLGGMLTAIGTPPNLIVSTYRVEAGYDGFAFFDFAPVGLVLMSIGVIFITLLGWRLIPTRKAREDESLFHIEDYLSEVIVADRCKMIGKTLRDFYGIHKLEVNVLSIIRNGRKIIAPLASEQLMASDILIVKAISSELTNLIEKTGLSLKGAKAECLNSETSLKSEDFALVEVVLREDSPLIGRTAVEIQLRNSFNVNLVAVSRIGIPPVKRLKTFRFKTGDILLMQVPESILQETYSKLRCLPLAERGVGLNVGKAKKKQYISLGIFLASIVATSAGVIPVQISFSLSAVLLVFVKVINIEEFYDAIEWPTIIMLGSLLPLGGALQSSGGSDTIANILIKVATILSPPSMLVVLMLLTIVLTNLINNSASAVLMAPIAISLAGFMGVSPDPLLMSVCVASSSAFLTPIGHQSNMLVMGPGGYHFTDYWRLGLPLSILVITIGVPLILYVWPF
ncbi:MAG: family permease [Anaerosolibacter sp.]|uniref:SLC13 family permease n=1 Tax=Anaerosolibacter sp. TaxID=1872527 RepID=UPI00261669CC|nr:SLC13 family permease [Anaerosolibacter sp.]MDF2548504.1 family permease [Anaerosolibacter sp.]